MAVFNSLLINYFPGTISVKKIGLDQGKDDPTLDMFGWEAASEKFSALYHADLRSGNISKNPYLIITNWTVGAHVEYYVGRCMHLETYGLGSIFDLHQFYYTNGDKSS